MAAFAAVYIIWGSTYLAIRFAVATIPPFLMAGFRFVIAGLILLLWARLRGDTRPTRLDWKTGLISGALLLLGGNGVVGWAEQRVTSGMAALLVAIVPLWMVLLDWWRPGGRKPANLVFVGLAVGLGGLVLLVGVDELRGVSNASISTGGALALIAASFSWAAGSLYIKHAPASSSGLNGAATQMMAGGATLLAVAFATREFSALNLAHVTRESWLGFLYLVTFGSLIGFTAYFYLLAHTTAAKASTYAYVNPVVAVFLGWLIAHEPVTARTVLAAAVILAGVAIITVARDRSVTVVSKERAVA